MLRFIPKTYSPYYVLLYKVEAILWTVNKKECMKNLLEMGVDVII